MFLNELLYILVMCRNRNYGVLILRNRNRGRNFEVLKFSRTLPFISWKCYENDDFWRKMMNFDEKLTILNIFIENNEKILVIFFMENHNGGPLWFSKNCWHKYKGRPLSWFLDLCFDFSKSKFGYRNPKSRFWRITNVYIYKFLVLFRQTSF
jgi:hypothetical protein